MRKTILVALIAVSMLFAFTACEPQSVNFPTANDKEIANITVDSAKVYAGESYSDSVLAFGTITYRDGSTTPNVNLNLKTATGLHDASKTYVGTVSIPSSNGNVSYKVEYEVIPVVEASYKLDDEADLNVAYVTLNSTCTINGDLTYVYEDGTEKTTNDYKLNWNAKKQADITAAQVVLGSEYTGGEEITISYDLTITGKTPVVISTWTQKAEAEGTKHFYGQPIEFVVEGKAQGVAEAIETVTQADFSSKFHVTSITTTNEKSETVTLTSVPTSYGLYAVTVKGYEIDNPYVSVEVIIPAGKDYVAGVNSANVYVPQAISANQEISAASFEVYATYASGDVKKLDSGNWKIVEAPAKAPAAGQQFTVTIAYKSGMDDITSRTVDKSVTVGTAIPVPATI